MLAIGSCCGQAHSGPWGQLFFGASELQDQAALPYRGSSMTLLRLAAFFSLPVAQTCFLLSMYVREPPGHR